MTWQPIHHSRDLYMIQTAIPTPTHWLLRGMKSIYAYNPHTGHLIWEITDVDRGLVHKNHEMLFLNNQLIATTFFGREQKRAYLFALDPATGQAIWQRPIAWPNGNAGRISGLKTINNQIIITEQIDKNPTISWIDPTTGHTIAQTPGLKTNFAAVATSHHIYYHNSWRGSNNALYQLPTRPGQPLIPVAPIGCQDLVASDEYLYAYIYRQDGQAVKKILWWDAASHEPLGYESLGYESLGHEPLGHEPLGQMTLPPANAYRYGQLLPTSQPDRLFLWAENQCCLLDLSHQQIVWEQQLPQRISYPELTAEGIFLSIFDQKTTQPLFLSETDGHIQTAPFPHSERIFSLPPYILGTQSFSATIFAPEPIPTPAEPPPWPRHPINTIITATNIPPDPRDTLQTTMLTLGPHDKFDPLYRQIRDLLTIRALPKMVKNYLTTLHSGALDAGPLNITPWSKLATLCFPYHHLFKFGPRDQFFPAFLIASETYGVEFWLMPATGDVISLHHDATFSEVAHDVWQQVDGDLKQFNRRFTLAGSSFNITQLIHFQQQFADYKIEQFHEIPAAEFYQRLATAFNWTYPQLENRLNHGHLEFLYHYYRDRTTPLRQLIDNNTSP
ncbi:MAG TPA: PQQ-binding-like beta-propeller repeat protein [Anaerolineae bacterium]|nr:PQQ-binding-like beta-propeller repeat protein [Anaerolineae bacterium]